MRPDDTPGLLVVPPGFVHERSLGWQLAHFYETFFCHGPGDIQEQPITVDEEFAAFLVMAYALGEGGRRLVSEAVLSRLKGWSKSEKAGLVACGEFKGPVRFDHWAKRGETSWWGYQFEKGEPVGREVRSPFIRCLATEEEQSGNTYDNVTVMLEYAQGKFPGEFGDIDLGRNAQSSTRIFRHGGGEIRPSTAASSSKDGGKESFIVGDEPHLWFTPELVRMDRTVSRNMTKRPIAEPWKLYTTTMYCPGENSVAEADHLEAVDIAKGKRPNRGMLFDHREGPDPDKFDWDDDAELAAALRETAGAAVWMDVEAQVKEIRDPQTSKADGVRYFLNRPHKGERQGIDPAKWDKLADPARAVEPGSYIGAGFDGSISDDATALVGCTQDRHRFLIGLWERPQGPRGKGWRVPRLEVQAAIRDMFATYRVGRLQCDTPKWETEIEAWALEFGDEVVLGIPTYSTARFAPMCSRFATSIEEKTGSHDGDARLRAHVLAMARRKVRVRDDDGDGRTRFVFDKSDGRKIDAGVACTLAEDAAATMPADSGSVYEERGLVTL